MVKTISKIGNSQGIIFDSSLMDMSRLKVGDQLNVTVHDSGSIILTPVRETITPEKGASTARRLIKKNNTLFKRLSE